MAELEGLYVSLNADTAGLDRGMRSAEQSVDRTERSVTASLGRMDKALEQVNRSTAAIAQRFGQFAAIVGVGAIGAMAAKTLDYAEAWTQVGNRLRLVASDAATLRATQEQLFQAAQKAGVGMTSVVDVYARASQAAGELGASQEQLTKFSGGVAQALAVSGTSAEAASGAMQQLGQLLGSTRVQAEEFNSILEGAPRIAKAVADGLTEAGGSVSRLKQLINDGKVSNKQFFDAFLGQIPKIQAEFETAVPTISRSLTTLNNAMTKMVGEADAATGATASMARGLQSLGENLEEVAGHVLTIGTALAGVYVARGLAPAIAGSAQFVAAQIALRSELLANTGHLLQKEAALRAGAAATVASAAADNAAAVAAKEKARADLVARAAQWEQSVGVDGAIGKTARLAQAEAALAEARTVRAAADARVAQTGMAVAMATTAQESAIARTSLAATMLSRAGAGLSSMLALVGGPWGAAFLAAAGAVYYLATRTTEADKAQEIYNRTLTEGRQRVQEMATATREQANALLEKQRNEVAVAQASLANAQAELAARQKLAQVSMPDAKPSELEGALGDLPARVEAARKIVEAAAAALDGLQSVSQKTGDAIGLELASKLAQGTSAFQRLSAATGDALKQAGLTVQSGRLMTNEQAQTEKAVTALGQALQAGAGFLRTYGTDADQVGRVMAALKLKIDPVASAIADMNREIAQLGVAEGAARSALAMLQQANKERSANLPPLTTVSPEYLQMLDKAKELETARVQAATNARAQVIGLEKQIATAQAQGNAVLVARLERQKAVAEQVARGVDPAVAAAAAQQDYDVAITEAGAASGQAAREILLAADAQVTMARAAGLGEAATRAAAQATKLAQEAAKAGGNVAAQMAANRREEAAAILTIRNETVRGLELETANTNALTLAMAAGGEAVRVAQEGEYRLALIRKLGTDATVAGTEAQKALNDAMDAYRNNRAANDNNRLTQAKQAANDNLALARRELDLMGQAEPVRARALTSLRLQQEAARKVGELGEDGARQWLAWQEQIADKQAYVDFLKEVQSVAKEISGDISEALYDRLMDSTAHTSIVDVFKATFKRIAVAALQANVILPIVTQVVGSASSLFGISSPTGGGQSITVNGQTYTAAGGNSLLSQGGNSLMSQGLSYGADKLGLNPTAGLTNLADSWGYSTLGIGSVGSWAAAAPASVTAAGAVPITGAASLNAATGIAAAGNTGAANILYTGAANGTSGAGISGGLGTTLGAAAPYGMLGGMLGSYVSNNYMGGSKIGGGAVGAVAGVGTMAAGTAAMGAMGMGAAASAAGVSGMAGATAALSAIPVYGWIAAAVLAAVMAIAGSQKPSVGPNAQGNVLYQDGRYVQGPAAADNGGDDTNVKAVTGAVATGFNTLADAYGIKLKAQNYGYWEGGTSAATGNGVHNDPKELIRQILGGAEASDPNSNMAKALANETVRASGDLEEIQKYLDVAHKIDTATEAFKELNKSLAQVEANAKKAAADGFAAIDEEIKTADKIDLGQEYRTSLEQSIRSTFEGAVQAATPWETAMATLRGSTDAWIEAVTRWNVGVSEAEIRADAAAKATKLRAQAMEEYNAALYQAQGRDYLTTLAGIDAGRDTTRRNFAALGVDDAAGKADTLVTAQLTSTLSGLGLAQLADVTTTLGGAIGGLAETMRVAAQATATEDLTVRSLRAQGQSDLADVLELRLKQEREYAQAVKDGYDATYLAGLQYVQALDAQAAATQRATAAAQAQAAAASYAADVQGRAYAALGQDRTASLLALDQRQAKELADARANGYDATQLQQVQAAERAAQAFQLAQADVLAAYDQQISAQQDYISGLNDGAVKLAATARQFRQAYDSLALNDNSPLNAFDRLEEARRQVTAAYSAYRDSGATDAARDAAQQSLTSLAPTLVQLAKGYYGSTNDTDYQWMRSILAEFGDATALGVDTAETSLKVAQDQLKELQSQRAAQAAIGQKNYGALVDLVSVADQSRAIWQDTLIPLLRSTGYSGTGTATTPTVTTADRRTRLAAFSDAQIESAFGGFDDIQAARRQFADFDLRLWFETFGINEVLAGTRTIPGFAAGGVIPNAPGSTPGVDSVPLLGMPGEGVVNLRGMGVLGTDGLAALNAGRWPANDRWSGNVAALRSGRGGSTASLERRLDRAVAVLERILAATEAGDADNAAATEEVAVAITTLARQTSRPAGPVGQRRTANG